MDFRGLRDMFLLCYFPPLQIAKCVFKNLPWWTILLNESRMDSFAIRFWVVSPSAFHKQHNRSTTKFLCLDYFLDYLIKCGIHFFPTNNLEKYLHFILFLFIPAGVESSFKTTLNLGLQEYQRIPLTHKTV